MNQHFVVTFHETDGNDCTVFDALIEATSQEQALAKLADSIESALVTNSTDFEDDGSELGYYFQCSADCDENCDGHGGIALRTVESFPTESEARASMSRYHSEWTV